MDLSEFQQTVANLTCRRIIEENHNDCIFNLLEENGHNGVYRYAAAISSTQVNIYDNKNEKASLGFYSHYVIHETKYFKGGNCTCGCWLYDQVGYPNDSILAVGTDKGEVLLMSCIECRIIGILKAPKETKLVILSTCPSHPSLLVGSNREGHVYIWNTEKCELVHEITDVFVYNLRCGYDDVLLYLGDDLLALLNLNTFKIRSIDLRNCLLFNREVLLSMLSRVTEKQWILLFCNRMVLIDQMTLKTQEITLSIPIPDYINSRRLSLTRNEKYIVIAENQRICIYDFTGCIVGEIVDNYAVGTSTNKDQYAYRRQPISTCILEPDGKFAIVTEENRILRFDSINPDNRYVSHIIFPHPVEDMFVFFNSLNADPLMYLNPKIKKT